MRYFVKRPTAFYDDDEPMLEGRTVYESDAVDTGLVDSDGRQIWRRGDAIGFLRHEDAE